MTEGGQKSAFFPPRMAWKKRFSPSVWEERGEVLLHSPTLNLQVKTEYQKLAFERCKTIGKDRDKEREK